MRCLFVVIAIVAMVTGDFLAEMSQNGRCCSPPQWESAMWATGGSQPPGKPKSRSVSVSAGAFISFDRNRQRFYMYVNGTYDTLRASVKILQDFKTGYQYIVNVNKNTCIRSNITAVFLSDGCVPRAAQYVTRAYYGAGRDRFFVNIYKLPVATKANSFVDFLMMSSSECIPVSETIVGTFSSFAVSVRLNYFQATRGIRNPSVLNLPEVCKKNAIDGPSTSVVEALFGNLYYE